MQLGVTWCGEGTHIGVAPWPIAVDHEVGIDEGIDGCPIHPLVISLRRTRTHLGGVPIEDGGLVAINVKGAVQGLVGVRDMHTPIQIVINIHLTKP